MFHLSEKFPKIRSKIGLAVTILALSACAHEIAKPPADEAAVPQPVGDISNPTPEPLVAPPPSVKDDAVRHQRIAKHKHKAKHSKKKAHLAAKHKKKSKTLAKYKFHKKKKHLNLAAAKVNNEPSQPTPPPTSTQQTLNNEFPIPPAPAAMGTIGQTDESSSSGFWDRSKAVIAFIILGLGIVGLIYVAPKSKLMKVKSKRGLILNS